MIEALRTTRQRMAREARTFGVALGLSFLGAVAIRLAMRPPVLSFSWHDLVSILVAYSLATVFFEHRTLLWRPRRVNPTEPDERPRVTAPSIQEAGPRSRKNFALEVEPAKESVSISVLIVNDDVQVREAVRVSLSQCNVMEVIDSRRAVTSIQTTRPDVILLDLAMPGLDGPSVLKAIKQHDPDVRLVILTAVASGGFSVSDIGKGSEAKIVRDVAALGHEVRKLVETLGS